MKLAIVGAGSTRLPLMLGSVAAASARLRLREVSLYDVRPDRMSALLPVGLALAAECGPVPAVRVHASPESCLEGADAVVLTVRPGFEEARARDERACLELGVIGQETTGPAGLAFAARSIPVVAACARAALASNPACVIAVFTNPAGLVTQALHALGLPAVGVCDSADVACRKVARRAGAEPAACDFEVSGLNHLSWTRAVRGPDGADLLGPALADDAFLASAFPAFRAENLRAAGRIPVEYLWYFADPGAALTALLAEPWTRGEALLEANRRMLGDVGRLADQGQVGLAIAVYADWLAARHASYMKYAMGGVEDGGPGLGLGDGHGDGAFNESDALGSLKAQVGGYAEVAMDLLAARSGAVPRLMALNVPNGGAVPGLDDDDVVECDCEVDAEGVRPRPRGPMPAEDLALVSRVKEYERLAVRAVLTGSSALFEDALAAHPLVPSREVAGRLVGALGL
ncbi:MAG: hypothetical protein FJ087_00905 [Deltaproteobacteria bacterium]|nr:hypothetical protein [Deltaproteobacteria bacterium]